MEEPNDDIDIINPSEFAVLGCAVDSGKLRVSVVSPYYADDIRCAFPQELRKPGKFYVIDARNIHVVITKSKPYYVVARGAPMRETTAKAVDDMEDEFMITCIACCSRDKGILFAPCGHFCACAKCAETLAECPICQLPIVTRIPWICNV